MALLDDIRTVLLAAGVANSTTWKCWVHYAPDTADQCISLHLSGGLSQDTLAGENVRPTFQVRVRAARLSHAVVEAKWWEVFAALNDADLSAYNIYLISAQNTGPLEWLDSANRPNMTLNFIVTMLSPAYVEPSPV